MPKRSEREVLLLDLLEEAEQIRQQYAESREGELRAMSPDASSSGSSSSSSTSSQSGSSSASVEMAVDDDADDEEVYARAMQMLEEVLTVIATTRVLHPGDPVAKSSQLPLVLDHFYHNQERQFRRNLRVSPSTFDALVHLIQDDPVFSNQSPTQDQLPVRVQLAITLYRLGHDGNSASVESVGQWAGYSPGLVYKATQRVFIAVLGLHDQAVHWPDAEEKERAKQWVEEEICAAWRDGFCMVDGTLVPLFEKPGWHGESYFCRKSCYALNVQIINLPNRFIIDYVLGHTGSSHDSTCFSDSRTAKEHRLLFKNGEWIWADSAYATRPWCVTPVKKPAANLPENKTFNYWVSHVRVRSEHTMGVLKGRFHSLRRLRQQISSERAHLRALTWIRVCIVLHNLIHYIEADNEDEEFIQELIREGREGDLGGDDDLPDAGGAEAQQLAAGVLKREQLKAALFEHLAAE